MIAVAWLTVLVTLFGVALGLTTGQPWAVVVMTVLLIVDLRWIVRHTRRVRAARRAAWAELHERWEQLAAGRAQRPEVANAAQPLPGHAHLVGLDAAAILGHETGRSERGLAGLPDPARLPPIGQITELGGPSDTHLSDGFL